MEPNILHFLRMPTFYTLEPATLSFRSCGWRSVCSIQLSYGTFKFKKEQQSLLFFVGVARFELATFCSQSRRDDRATLHPEVLFNVSQRERDSNPRYRYQYVSLANWWFQPLTHPSISLKRNANICLFYFLTKYTSKKTILFFKHIISKNSLQ
jgi:hypothetical protein